MKAICENPTPPSKMKIRLAYTEGNVCKDTKNHELQIMFHLSTMRHRNNFYIFLSLTVKSENILLKIYCLLRLQSQKFILSSVQVLNSLSPSAVYWFSRLILSTVKLNGSSFTFLS